MFPPRSDQRRVVLSRALTQVTSGEAARKVSRSEAETIIRNLPEAILWRIWLVYRGNLPNDRYYSSGGLYTAPEPMAYHRKIEEHEEATGAQADQAHERLHQQFGAEAAADAAHIGQTMLKNAQKAGVLRPASSEAARG